MLLNGNFSESFRAHSNAFVHVLQWLYAIDTAKVVTTKVSVTSIEVVDLLVPYIHGGKINLFGGSSVGKTVGLGADQ